MSKIVSRVITIVVVLQLLFLIPLAVACVCWWQAYQGYNQRATQQVARYVRIAHPFYQISSATYTISKPLFGLLQVKPYTDQMMRIGLYTDRAATTGVSVIQEARDALPLIYKTDKTIDEQKQLYDTITTLKTQTPTLASNLFLLGIETHNVRVKKLASLANLAQRVTQKIDSLGGRTREGKFLVLLLNDRELRPGGGFIGSYAVVTFAHYSLKSIDIKDVYDVDGQLTEHVDPPEPIRVYVQNPHWFLRDSNFSPDFAEDAKKAMWFIDKSVHDRDFDGVIGVTTQAMSDFVGAYDSLMITDSSIPITQKNFYSYTQSSSEANFFPGSQQKKTTLKSIAQAMILQFDHASKDRMASAARSALDTKQIVIYMSDSQLQQAVEQYSWGGRQSIPVDDYVMPVDANVGANKSNQYITRSITHTVKLTRDMAQHTFNETFTNTSKHSDDTQAIYKNYFQVYIPRDMVVRNAWINGQVASYEIWPEQHYIVPTVYFELHPGEHKTVTFAYEAKRPSSYDTMIYEQTIQKQIGVVSIPYTLNITLPQGASLLSHDFKAQVRDGVITYSDTIERDQSISLHYLLPR